MKFSACMGAVILIICLSVVSRADQPLTLNNAITDVPGIQIGHYTDMDALTGTTVILVKEGAVAGVDIRGAAPGTRETDLLNPTNLVDEVNAIVLSGGSAYGLASADGVMKYLQAQKIGYPVGGGNVVPIVPAAVLFDLGRCGTDFKVWPDAGFGYNACLNAKDGLIAQGNVGAGTGAQSGGLKGGIGTASTDLGDGVIVGAIVAVNAVGSTVNPETGEFYAGFLERDNEFGELKPPNLDALVKSRQLMDKGDDAPIGNTTIAVVATNVSLTKAQAQKIAQMAHDGMARAIRPSHTMFDGDTIFAVSTKKISLDKLQNLKNVPVSINKIGSTAADTLSRAIVHGMLAAESVDGCMKNYCDTYPDACSNRRK